MAAFIMYNIYHNFIFYAVFYPNIQFPAKFTVIYPLA